MYSALLVSVILIAAILLVLVILAQNSKGGGLSSQFGGSGASNMIGVKKTTDLLEKITWGLAIAILSLSLLSNVNIQRETETDYSDRIQQLDTQTPSLEGIDQGSLEGIEDLEIPSATDSSGN